MWLNAPVEGRKRAPPRGVSAAPEGSRVGAGRLYSRSAETGALARSKTTAGKTGAGTADGEGRRATWPRIAARTRAATEGEPMPRIRDAAYRDADALTGLMGQLGYPTAPVKTARRFREIAVDPSYTTLVAEAEGRVVGMVGTSSTRTPAAAAYSRRSGPSR